MLHRYGGWVVDGFPLNRKNWAAMIDHELLPDSVVTLSDENAPADYLLTRFTQKHGLPDPSTFKIKESEAMDEVGYLHKVYWNTRLSLDHACYMYNVYNTGTHEC